jgi:hypothetical protein
MTSISQAYCLTRVCGEDTVQLRGENSMLSSKRIKLIDPSQFFDDNSHYDLILNIDSLKEMDENSAIRYLTKFRCSLLS